MRFFLSICLTLIAVTVLAQQPTWEASTNARKVTTQTIFEVSFTLMNANGSNFEAPDFKCFDFISGPSRSMSTTIVNGARSQSLEYTYTLMRSRPGTCTIGPASIRVNGRTLSTKPITIEIVEGKPGDKTSEAPDVGDVILKAEITDKPVYPGQQVHLDYKVYTTVNIRNYNTLTEDSYDQFYYRYIQDFNNRAQLEVVNGTQYTVQKIKSLALFPQQSGTFTIKPLVASFGLTVRDERPSFFFGSRTVPKTVASDSAVLRVLPLPANAPAAFTGAVGTYRMEASINQNRLTTDDAIVLTLDITGDGDPRRWSAPALDDLKATYELYDPKVLRDEAVDQGGTIRHRRTIEYLLIPRQAGDRTLQLDFAYFDPDSAVYRVLQTPAFQLHVTQGTHQRSDKAVYSADAAALQMRGLKPPSGNYGPIFLFTPLYFALLLIPFGALGFVWWKRHKEDLFDALDPVEKKRRKARRMAEQHLEEARQHLAGGSERAYYDSLSRAIYGYLSAKLNVRTSDLTKSNIADQLMNLDLPQVLRDETMQILNTSEQVLYAASTSGADRQQMYDRTLALIEAVEGKLSASN